MLRLKTRRCVFWGTVISYVIAAALLLAFGNGYRVRWWPFAISRTGNVLVTFEPTDATVTLDGKNIGTSSPVRLRALFPGTHHVLISRAGSVPFAYTFQVQPLQTTFVSDVFLVADATAELMGTSTTNVWSDQQVAAPPTLTVSDLAQIDGGEKMADVLAISGAQILEHTYARTHSYLVYSRFELWNIDGDRHTTTLITRLSTPIRAVFAPTNTSLAIVATTHEIFAYELGVPDAEPTVVARGADLMDFVLSQDEQTITFTDKQKNEYARFDRALF